MAKTKTKKFDPKTHMFYNQVSISSYIAYLETLSKSQKELLQSNGISSTKKELLFEVERLLTLQNNKAPCMFQTNNFYMNFIGYYDISYIGLENAVSELNCYLVVESLNMTNLAQYLDDLDIDNKQSAYDLFEDNGIQISKVPMLSVIVKFYTEKSLQDYHDNVIIDYLGSSRSEAFLVNSGIEEVGIGIVQTVMHFDEMI